MCKHRLPELTKGQQREVTNNNSKSGENSTRPRVPAQSKARGQARGADQNKRHPSPAKGICFQEEKRVRLILLNNYKWHPKISNNNNNNQLIRQRLPVDSHDKPCNNQSKYPQMLTKNNLQLLLARRAAHVSDTGTSETTRTHAARDAYLGMRVLPINVSVWPHAHPPPPSCPHRAEHGKPFLPLGPADQGFHFTI